jgi:hypothetical protein
MPGFVMPKAGDTVLTVVIVSRAPGGGWVIPFTYATFMPGASGAPLCVIDGPADPRVFETLKKIQQARIRGGAKEAALQAEYAAEKAAATRPTTRPANRLNKRDMTD